MYSADLRTQQEILSGVRPEDAALAKRGLVQEKRGVSDEALASSDLPTITDAEDETLLSSWRG